MSDAEKPSPAAPAAPASDVADRVSKALAPTFGAPLGIVKGGTPSARHEEQLAQRKHEIEKAQALQQGMKQRHDEGFQDGGVARLASFRMMDPASPLVVLRYMNRDKTVRQEGTADIVEAAKPDGTGFEKILVLFCPKCVERGVHPVDAQMKVHYSHRKFYLDTREQDEGKHIQEVLHNPLDPANPIVVTVIGKLYVDDILRCKNTYCTWAVRIQNSEVWEV